METSSVVTKLLHSFGVFSERYLRQISNNFEKIPKGTGLCYIPINGELDEIHIIYKKNISSDNLITNRFTLNDDLSLFTEHGREFSSIDNFFKMYSLKRLTLKTAYPIFKVAMLTGNDMGNSLTVICIGGVIADAEGKTLAYFVVRTEGIKISDIEKEFQDLKFISFNDIWAATDSKFKATTYPHSKKFEKFLYDMKEIVSGELVTYQSFQQYKLDAIYPCDNEEPFTGVNYYTMWKGVHAYNPEDLKSELLKLFPNIINETFVKRDNIDKKEFPSLIEQKEEKEKEMIQKKETPLVQKKEIPLAQKKETPVVQKKEASTKTLKGLSAKATVYKPSS